MMLRQMRLGAVIPAALPMALSLLPLFAHAQAVGPSASEGAFSIGSRFVERSGEGLYVNVCQGCHMPDGRGATGAGAYPSLAGNNHLETVGYPIAIILNGQRAMPPFGAMMSDDQVAAVVNYVRTHFGNSYHDAVTVEDVRAARRSSR
jgi:mono/diheme cytochrome c family protein